MGEPRFPRQIKRPPRGRRPLCQGERRRGRISPRVRGAGTISFGVQCSAWKPSSLTSLARAGGCAAKYAAGRLETLLAGLVPADADDLLVGLDPADDAAVYRLDDERAIVFTVDFFPPLVDDPRTFGANRRDECPERRLRDGWRLRSSRSRWPRFPKSCRSRCSARCSRARTRRVRAAGAILAGGSHDSRRRAEVRSGRRRHGASGPHLAEGGCQARRRAPADEATRDRNRPASAARRPRTGGALEAAVESMLELNMAAADVLRPFEPTAVTDVTGFGLLGHTHELATRSGVRAILDAECAARRCRRRWSWRLAAFAQAAIAGTGTSSACTSRATPTRLSRRWHSTHRPPAACWCRSPANGRPSSRRPLLPRGCSPRASAGSKRAQGWSCGSGRRSCRPRSVGLGSNIPARSQSPPASLCSSSSRPVRSCA